MVKKKPLVKNKPGRPAKEIDWDIFEGLCQIQCNQVEMAGVFRVHIDTLRDHAIDNYDMPYPEIYKQFAEGGKATLRRYQFNLAKTNAAMAIWLGKQWLGQKESTELSVAPETSAQF